MFCLCPPLQPGSELLSFIHRALVTQASFQFLKLKCFLLPQGFCRCHDARCLTLYSMLLLSLPYLPITHFSDPRCLKSEIKCHFLVKPFLVPSTQVMYTVIELSSFPSKHAANLQQSFMCLFDYYLSSSL